VPISGGQGRGAVSDARRRGLIRALPGNTNALSHGLHTRDAVEQRRQVQDLMRRSLRFLKEIE